MPPKRESMSDNLLENQYENLTNTKVKRRCNYNLVICSGICAVFISLGVYSGYMYYNKLNNNDGSLDSDLF